MDDLTSTFGTWRVAWGDLTRLERRQSGGEEPFRDDVKSLPVAGAPGDVGIVINFYARPEKDQKARSGVAGHPFFTLRGFGPEGQPRALPASRRHSLPPSPHLSPPPPP